MPKITGGAFALLCDSCGKKVEGTLHYKPPTDAWVYLSCALCYTKFGSHIAPMVEPDENQSV